MTKEALRLALEALEDLGMKHYESTGEVLYKETFTAIKEALANQALEKMAENARELGLDYEPAQEPVAWMFQHNETGRMSYVSNDGLHNPTTFIEMNPRYALVCPLYTTPPQRKPLTEDEVVKMDEWLFDQPFWRVLMLVRAIEAAHGIKGEA